MRHDSASVIGLYRPPSLRCGFLRRQRQVADRCRRGSESTHAPNSCPSACCISCRCDANEDTAYPVLLVFPHMLIDALVTDTSDAILRQTAANPIRTPLLLRQFLLNQHHQVRRHFARLVRSLLASLQGFLVRLLETIATRAGVTNKLAADRRWIDANRPRDVSLRASAPETTSTTAMKPFIFRPRFDTRSWWCNGPGRGGPHA